MPRRAASAEAARGKVWQPWRPRDLRVASGARVPRCPPPHSSPPCSRCWCLDPACSCCSRLWHRRGCRCAPRPCATGKVSSDWGGGMTRFLSPGTSSIPHCQAVPSLRAHHCSTHLGLQRVFSKASSSFSPIPSLPKIAPCVSPQIHSFFDLEDEYFPSLPQFYKYRPPSAEDLSPSGTKQTSLTFIVTVELRLLSPL